MLGATVKKEAKVDVIAKANQAFKQYGLKEIKPGQNLDHMQAAALLIGTDMAGQLGCVDSYAFFRQIERAQECWHTLAVDNAGIITPKQRFFNLLRSAQPAP